MVLWVPAWAGEFTVTVNGEKQRLNALPGTYVTLYFRRVEPKIMFAGVDSGVANPVRADGSTLLDEVWVAAPFSAKNVFVDRVNAVARRWVGEGLMSVADHDGVIRTARNAPIR
ncbi:glycoside hydrolase family 127 protein [Lentzea sp. NBC_00516]|uniref:hypothetical protein n=1 Tax=Lentzea sp. NBC_00516 TaxID=2903582 RepID=UPI002E81F2B1|nr:hypothetical protein [Lentzea sp. NBC_00516]WUD27344.1 glycoside hydrolase family 127 protein [Lentzea sp. NBC_00516]